MHDIIQQLPPAMPIATLDLHVFSTCGLSKPNHNATNETSTMLPVIITSRISSKYHKLNATTLHLQQL